MKQSLPNVILLGAQKAGTSSLYNWLSQHPDIFAPDGMKDYNFFCNKENLQLGVKWFSKSFVRHTNQNIILHGHVNYIFYADSAASNIYNFNKDIKLILILRNPIERSYSAYWDARKVALEDVDNFEDAIKKEEERMSSGDSKQLDLLTYLEHGYYSKQIKEYLKYFSRDQIKIIFFEDLKNHPKNTVQDVFSFLKVEKDFCPVFEKVNLAGLPRSILLQRLLQKIKIPRVIKGFISTNYTSKIKTKLIREFNVRKLEYPKMKNETRNVLLSRFSNEIDELEELLDVNLNHWRC